MTEFTKDKLKMAIFESKLSVMDDIIEHALRDMKNEDVSDVIREAIDDLKEVIKSAKTDLENIEQCKTTVTEW